MDERTLLSVASDIADVYCGQPTPEEKKAMIYAVTKFYADYIMEDGRTFYVLLCDKCNKEMGSTNFGQKKEQKVFCSNCR